MGQDGISFFLVKPQQSGESTHAIEVHQTAQSSLVECARRRIAPLFSSCSSGKGAEHISRVDEEMWNNAVPSYDRQLSVWRPLTVEGGELCTSHCLHRESATLKKPRTSLSFPFQEVPGLAELLPLVSITFLCGSAEAALRPGAAPKAGQLTVVWTFPLSSSVILFYFSTWTEATSSYNNYCVLWGSEQHSNEVADLISALQLPAGQQRLARTSNTQQAL